LPVAARELQDRRYRSLHHDVLILEALKARQDGIRRDLELEMLALGLRKPRCDLIDAASDVAEPIARFPVYETDAPASEEGDQVSLEGRTHSSGGAH
jgi:hypothetical protein